MDGGGGGECKYVKLLYLLATTAEGGGGESKFLKLLYVLAPTPPTPHPYSYRTLLASILGLDWRGLLYFPQALAR